MRNCLRRFYSVLMAIAILSLKGTAQISPDPYVPCQQMPSLIGDYNADLRSLVRFYTSSYFGGRGAGNNFVQTEGGSPEKRARLNTLYHDYLNRLEKLDFKSLPQECKVDYILFKRELNGKLQQAADEAIQYEKIKSLFPFSDSIYAIEKLRRRGHNLNPELLAKNWFDYARLIATQKQK
ncbi:hypothetical protein ACQ86N_19220 [Puia sp. P3]|uniref:hypothetical protein n=1 Tax=Puia sp. P3 TaxID=3423952 RepID=UPI003D673858